MFRTGDYGFCNEDGSIEIIAPVLVRDLTRAGCDLSRVEIQRLTSALACTARTDMVAVLAFRLQIHFFIVDRRDTTSTHENPAPNQNVRQRQSKTEKEHALSASMEEHVQFLQEHGVIPPQLYVDSDHFHILPDMPVKYNGKLDRTKLRDLVICREMQNPPSVLGSVSQISLRPAFEELNTPVAHPGSPSGLRKHGRGSFVREFLSTQVQQIRSLGNT